MARFTRRTMGAGISWGIAAIASTLLAVAKADAAPIDAFGRLPTVDQVTVSPGGTHIALVVAGANGQQVQIRKIDDLAIVSLFNIGTTKIVGLDWADEDNLLIVSAKAAEVMDLQGPLREWWLAYDYDLKSNKIHLLMNTTSTQMNVVEGWPQPRRVNGKTKLFMTGLSFPRSTGLLTVYQQDPAGSFADETFVGNEMTSDILIGTGGDVVARVDYHQMSGHWSLLSRSNRGTWHVLHQEEAPIDKPSLEGFGRTQDTLIVEQGSRDETRYREIPIAGGEWSAPIAELDGAGLIKDPVKRTVIGGVVYDGMALRYHFLDPADQLWWDKVIRAFPGETVRLASWSDDRSKILLRVEGPTNGAAFFRLDVKTRHADGIANQYAGIGPEDLGEVRPIHYKASDGREIPAYLTLPRGAPARGLPLVLLVHGGPAARDEPGFDWWAQAIASLGYAVLQPQFRGSSGFDPELLSAGFGQWGRKMQTDLSDGVQFLANQGIVDPGRVCITGASYGGYAAMAGVTLQTGIYKCAVAVAGVSDLRQFLSSRADLLGSSNSTLRYWQRFMGALSASDPALDALSPARHVDRLSAPLLLIHGTIDTVVPFAESKTMLDAAKRAGKPVQLVTLAEEDHNLSKSSTRLQMLRAMADFLRVHLPVNAPGSEGKAAAGPPATAPRQNP